MERGYVEAIIDSASTGGVWSGVDFSEVVQIPVAIHVVGPVANQAITDTAPLFAQIDVLNAAYDVFDIQFVLQSIHWVNKSEWNEIGRGMPAEVSMKETLHLPTEEILNLYVCNTLGYIGWAYFPHALPEGSPLDGVVVSWAVLPQGKAPFEEGDTAVHETGHFLGLLHTFQVDCSGTDQIDDTPAHLANYGRPPITTDTCPDHPGFDPVHNFMNYVDDAWMSEFTVGQRLAVVAICEALRPIMVAKRYLWADYPWIEGNWRTVPRLGWINDGAYPWHWHPEQGWWWTKSESPQAIWFYDTQLGWVFTNTAVYPHLYSHERGEWILYVAGAEIRWFWSASLGDYFTVPRSG